LELDPDHTGVRKLDLIICFYVYKRFLEVSKNLFYLIAKLCFYEHPMFNIDIIIIGTLALLVARSGAKLENTSLSTGGSKAPAYDYVYIAQLHFRSNEFSINK